MAQTVSHRPLTEPGTVHVGFMVHEVALEQVFLQVLRVSPVSIIPAIIYTHHLHGYC
jgi:hypothetical protein